MLMSPKTPIRAYDYVVGRNTVPMSDRYDFDVNKLVNAGVVFITPAMDGDPESPTYKRWLDEGGSHLITLYNVEHSSPDGWIRKAITKKSDTSGWRDNFIGKLYDGKYNQILWSLEKLRIDPNDMVIEDNSLQENILRIKEVISIHEGLLDTSGSDEGKSVTPTGAWAIKYNNPMALIQLKPSDWDGLVGDDKGRLKFKEMWYGVRAGVKNLKNSYFGRGNKTLSGIMKVYAPSGHGDNNPENYAKFLADKLGVSVDDELNFKDYGKKIARSIINVETGIPVGGSGGVSNSDFQKGFEAALI